MAASRPGGQSGVQSHRQESSQSQREVSEVFHGDASDLHRANVGLGA